MREYFGPKKDRTIWDAYIDNGDWLLFKINGSIEAGVPIRVEDGYLVLKPHVGMIARMGRLTNAIVHREAGIPVEEHPRFRVISLKEALMNCISSNVQLEITAMNEEIQRITLQERLKQIGSYQSSKGIEQKQYKTE